MTSAVESQYQTPRLDFDEADSTPAPGVFEPLVNERVIACFLQVTPRRVLEMARKGHIPAHPLGSKRRTWRFRVSEISAHFSSAPAKQTGDKIHAAVPRILGRKGLGSRNNS